jgi:hypothetical protein
MSNITATFSVQTLDGSTNNIVGINRSGSLTVAYTATIYEQLNVAASSTDVQFTLPATPNKVISIENAGTVDLSYRINSNTGTQLILNKGGFFVLTTSTAITSVYFTNSDTANACPVKIFIGG